MEFYVLHFVMLMLNQFKIKGPIFQWNPNTHQWNIKKTHRPCNPLHQGKAWTLHQKNVYVEVIINAFATTIFILPLLYLQVVHGYSILFTYKYITHMGIIRYIYINKKYDEYTWAPGPNLICTGFLGKHRTLDRRGLRGQRSTPLWAMDVCKFSFSSLGRDNGWNPYFYINGSMGTWRGW